MFASKYRRRFGIAYKLDVKILDIENRILSNAINGGMYLVIDS